MVFEMYVGNFHKAFKVNELREACMYEYFTTTLKFYAACKLLYLEKYTPKISPKKLKCFAISLLLLLGLLE